MSVRAIGIDAAITEIADENVAAELAEVRGRLNDAPGSVQRTTTGKPSNQIAVRVKLIDEPFARPGHLIFGVGIFCAYVTLSVPPMLAMLNGA